MRRLSIKIFLCLLPLLFSAEGYALEWQDLWQTPDQQAEQAFQQKQYEQAAGQFTQPQWKAAAQYKQGEYQQVLESLKDRQSSDALYNKGNAHAQLGQFKEAIQAYDKTLQLDPENTDAKFNKELVEKELKKQQQQQDQQQGDSDSDQQKQDKDNSQEQEQQDQEGGQQEQNESQQGEQEQGKSEKGENADSQNKSGEESADDNQKGEKSQQQKYDEQERKEAQAKEQAAQQKQQEDEQSTENFATAGEPTKDEQQQANEQWLKRIPDDPAGLLKRKFKYQYNQRQRTPNRQAEQW